MFLYGEQVRNDTVVLGRVTYSESQTVNKLPVLLSQRSMLMSPSALQMKLFKSATTLIRSSKLAGTHSVSSQAREFTEKLTEALENEYTVEGALLDDMEQSLVEGAMDRLDALSADLTAGETGMDGSYCLRPLWDNGLKSAQGASGQYSALDLKKSVIQQVAQGIKSGAVPADLSAPESVVKATKQAGGGEQLLQQVLHRCDEMVSGLKPLLASAGDSAHELGAVAKSALGPLASMEAAGHELLHALSACNGGTVGMVAAAVLAGAAIKVVSGVGLGGDGIAP